MANITYNVSDFLAELQQLENADEISKKMLEESSYILEESLKNECQSHKKSGAMINSIKSTKAKESAKDGWHITVCPTGKDERGVTNMEKLAYLEYGTSKQAPTPILKNALKKAESDVYKKMQEVFEREVTQ